MLLFVIVMTSATAYTVIFWKIIIHRNMSDKLSSHLNQAIELVSPIIFVTWCIFKITMLTCCVECCTFAIYSFCGWDTFEPHHTHTFKRKMAKSLFHNHIRKKNGILFFKGGETFFIAKYIHTKKMEVCIKSACQFI